MNQFVYTRMLPALLSLLLLDACGAAPALAPSGSAAQRHLLSAPAGPSLASLVNVTTLAGPTNDDWGHIDAIGQAARFSGPACLALDAARTTLYAADMFCGSPRTIAVGPNAAPAVGTYPRSVMAPWGVAVAPDGSLIVSDCYQQVVWRFETSGAARIILGSPGVRGFRDGTSLRGPAPLCEWPQGVAVDANGIVYVADTDNLALRRIEPHGNVTTIAGGHGGGYADGPALTAKFANMGGLACDAAGKVYIADSRNHAVRVYDPLTKTVATAFAGAIDGVDADVQAVALDGAGHVYFTDGAGRRVARATLASHLAEVVAGTGAPTTIDGKGDQACFTFPVGIAVDGARHLVYVSDFDGQCIRRICL
ncbi:MAG: hypothetical protein JWM80_3837 [Cyanobacteria bacterium RYN_339]|nr:hypothetical protein [Cyanobacteria bacterium RYN_339]